MDVDLRMIGGRVGHLSFEGFPESFPEIGHKLGSSVRVDLPWEVGSSKTVINKQLNSSFGCKCLLAREKNGPLVTWQLQINPMTSPF